MTSKHSLVHVPSDALVANLAALVRRGNELTAEVLAHLVEVERRELHLVAGCSAMFVYCTDVLGLSEAAAYRRITAARVAARFPFVFELVSSGALHLAGIGVLAPHLTEANHRALMSAASHMSKRRIEELVAARFPKPDVPTTIRKLPERRLPVPQLALANAATPRVSNPAPRQPPTEDRGFASSKAAAVSASSPAVVTLAHDLLEPPLERSAPPSPPLAARRDKPRDVIQPLSFARYRVQLTIDQGLHDKLDRARALLSHQIPDGDLAKVLDRALTVLIDERLTAKFAAVRSDRVERKKRKASAPAKSVARGARAAATAGPRSVLRRRASERSRHIPHDVRREVLARDGERCTFVGADGRRCRSTHFLELDHLRPWALGGWHLADNLRVVCHAHNQHRARIVFGGSAIRRRQKRNSSRDVARREEPAGRRRTAGETRETPALHASG